VQRHLFLAGQRHAVKGSNPAVNLAPLETLSCGMAGLKIFVSYTGADRDWAHWIAWTLKEAGHTPFVHEWEVPAGGNIPDWMERRVKEADHLIGVFSDRYIDPVYSKSERTAAFWSDPIGNEGFLIPIEVSRVSEWPRFVAPLNRLSLLDRDPDAAREALIAFLEPRGPPKEAPKFPGAKPKARAEEAASFAKGGEALAPREPLFPPQERQLIGEVAQEKGVDPERLRPILENLGLADVPVDEIADKLREAVDALRAKADAPAPPSNAGPDLDAARAKAGEKLRGLDTDGALAVWDAFMAEDAFEAALRRRTAAMKEKAEILRLRYDYAEAAAVLREVARLDPDDTWSHVALGDIAEILNDSTQALQAFRAAEAAARRMGDDRDVSVTLTRTGDVLLAHGDLAGALARYEEGLEIARRLASADPSHAERQRDLSVNLNKTGVVLRAQGDLAGALTRFEEGLAIRRRLANADSSDARCQRDLLSSFVRTGGVLFAQDDLAGALARFEEGLEIARRLASAEPSLVERQRDVSVSLERTGEVLFAQGELAGALAHYQEGLEISRRLAGADPSHAERRRDVSVSLEKTGDVLRAQGDLAGALAAYEEGLAIRRRLASADPSHAERQRDLSVSLSKLARTAHAQGEPEQACRHLQEALAIMRPLAERFPEHPGFRRDLQWIEERRAEWRCGDPAAAGRKRRAGGGDTSKRRR